jgi:hypothetical protein
MATEKGGCKRTVDKICLDIESGKAVENEIADVTGCRLLVLVPLTTVGSSGMLGML